MRGRLATVKWLEVLADMDLVSVTVIGTYVDWLVGNMVQEGIGVAMGGWWVQGIPSVCNGLVCLLVVAPSENVSVLEHVSVQV